MIVDEAALSSIERPGRRRIFLMRHGDVTYFEGSRPAADVHVVPLNDQGRRQAAAAGSLLADVPLDRVITSPLVRCQQTARLAAPRYADRPTIAEPLREIEPGPLSRLAELSLPEAFVRAFHDELRSSDRFLGGETFGAHWQRVHDWLGRLLSDPDWRQVLVVAHGGTNRVLLAWGLGAGLEVFGRLEQDAGCINIIDVDHQQRPLVRLINFTPYNAIKHGIEHTTMERLFLQFAGRL